MHETQWLRTAYTYAGPRWTKVCVCCCCYEHSRLAIGTLNQVQYTFCIYIVVEQVHVTLPRCTPRLHIIPLPIFEKLWLRTLHSVVHLPILPFLVPITHTTMQCCVTVLYQCVSIANELWLGEGLACVSVLSEPCGWYGSPWVLAYRV